MVTMVLDAKGAERQRDRICADLYAMLFTFVVENANRETVPTTPEESQRCGNQQNCLP